MRPQTRASARAGPPRPRSMRTSRPSPPMTRRLAPTRLLPPAPAGLGHLAPRLPQRADSSVMEAFFDPGSVAVLGASNDPSKWGFWLAAGALTGAHRRRVHLINSRAASVQGRPTFAHLSELPEIPELLVISIPRPAVPAAGAEALAAGVRAFLIISARVPNAEDLAARIIAAGARLIGPNSLGLVDSANELLLAWGHFTPGSLAVVTQSGQLG